jgi:hypothetical protein
VNKASHAIRKQDVNLLRFNQCGHFALAKCGVHHGLSGAISPGLVVGRARIHFTARSGGSPAFEASDSSAFRTGNPRDLATLGKGSDYVATFFATLHTKLFDPITNHKCWFLRGFVNGNFLLIHDVLLYSYL